MEKKTASATLHMTASKRDKLTILSRLEGLDGELSPFLDLVTDRLIVDADLRFQLMQQAFGITLTERTPTEGENDA